MREIEIKGTPEQVVAQIKKIFTLEQQKNLYAWICVFEDACEDCKKYHGQMAFLSVWQKSGVPGRGKTKCGRECTCKLIHYELYPRYYAPLTELPLKSEVIKSTKSGENYKIIACEFKNEIDRERYSLKSFDPEEENELLVWLAECQDSCAECLSRHGKIKTWSEWKQLGLPGDSFCPVCHCSLIAAADYKKYYVPIEKLPFKDNSVIEEEKKQIEEEARQEQKLREDPIFAMRVYDSIYGTDNYGLYLKNIQEKVLSILKEHNGILQNDFYKHCTCIAQDDVRLVLNLAEREGKILRKQKGTTYQLFFSNESKDK